MLTLRCSIHSIDCAKVSLRVVASAVSAGWPGQRPKWNKSKRLLPFMWWMGCQDPLFCSGFFSQRGTVDIWWEVIRTDGLRNVFLTSVWTVAESPGKWRVGNDKHVLDDLMNVRVWYSKGKMLHWWLNVKQMALFTYYTSIDLCNSSQGKCIFCHIVTPPTYLSQEQGDHVWLAVLFPEPQTALMSMHNPNPNLSLFVSLVLLQRPMSIYRKQEVFSLSQPIRLDGYHSNTLPVCSVRMWIGEQRMEIFSDYVL